MCGISAYLGYNNAYDYLIYGLQMLQNRGFDSAGICTIDTCDNTNKFVLRKWASTAEEHAIKKLEGLSAIFANSTIGIAHTRWSTHGSKTDVNSHPHLDHNGQFCIVHNGIIENYAALKKELMEEYGVPFLSQTDTEVIVNLISVYYDKCHDAKEAISLALKRLEGTYGLVIMCINNPTVLFCARHGSPLLIGFGDNFAIIASEQAGFSKFVNNYICLENNDIVMLEKRDDLIIFQELYNYPIRNITVDCSSHSPAPYPHWTIKEINEQYESSLRAMGMGARIQDSKTVRLGGLTSHVDELKQLDNLILLGCGTSYHSGLYCSYVIKRISGFNTVQVFDGASFTQYDIPKTGRTGLIFISQSGETKDLHRAIDIGKDNNCFMIGVVNVIDSLIAREVHCGVYLNAGREVAVASTKAFSSQVIVLTMIAVWFAQIRGINENKRMEIIEGLRRLPIDIKSAIEQTHDECRKVAAILATKNSLFVLGKGSCEPIAQEGALKIKEIGYIMTAGLNSSALKHGSYAVLDDGFPVIILVPDDHDLAKNKGIIEELAARDAYIVAITNAELHDDKAAIRIRIPKNDPFRGLLSTIPLQLIAYEMAVIKGVPVDLPRNLAKTVTVD